MSETGRTNQGQLHIANIVSILTKFAFLIKINIDNIYNSALAKRVVFSYAMSWKYTVKVLQINARSHDLVNGCKCV